jgi:hypothetical protein
MYATGNADKLISLNPLDGPTIGQKLHGARGISEAFCKIKVAGFDFAKTDRLHQLACFNKRRSGISREAREGAKGINLARSPFKRRFGKHEGSIDKMALRADAISSRIFAPSRSSRGIFFASLQAGTAVV